MREKNRGQVYSRHTYQQNGDNIMQEGKSGSAAGTEVSAETEMDSGKQAVPRISVQLLAAHTDNFRSVCSGGVRKE